MHPDLFVSGILWYVVFLFSMTCHEAAHVLIARREIGEEEREAAGLAPQLSFHPAPHIRREFLGMVVVPVLSFLASGWMMGWASLPVHSEWMRRNPHRTARIALAGPAAHFLLAALACGAIHLGLSLRAFCSPDVAHCAEMVKAIHPGLSEALARLFSLFFSLNLLLGVFNLLPIPPLDGFTVLSLFMNENRARRFETFGSHFQSYGYAGLLLSWRVFGHLYDFLLWAALKILYPSTQYGF
jgi:Zn-dependent protease